MANGKLDRRLIESASHGSEIGFWYQHDGKSIPDMPATFSQGAEFAKGYYDDLIDSGELVYTPKVKKPKDR